MNVFYNNELTDPHLLGKIMSKSLLPLEAIKNPFMRGPVEGYIDHLEPQHFDTNPHRFDSSGITFYV